MLSAERTLGVNANRNQCPHRIGAVGAADAHPFAGFDAGSHRRERGAVPLLQIAPSSLTSLFNDRATPKPCVTMFVHRVGCVAILCGAGGLGDVLVVARLYRLVARSVPDARVITDWPGTKGVRPMLGQTLYDWSWPVSVETESFVGNPGKPVDSAKSLRARREGCKESGNQKCHILPAINWQQ